MTATALRVEEAAAPYRVAPLLTDHLDSFASAPEGFKRLRELVLNLAVRGRLVESAGFSGWEYCTLGDVGDWGSGGTPIKTHPEYYGGNVPWLVIGDLTDGPVYSATTHISAAGLANSSAKMVPPDTLLVAMYGSIGKLGIAKIECATNQAIAYCVPDKSKIQLGFLFNYLLAIRTDLTDRGQGLAQQNISQKILKAFPIKLPPPAEQSRIVAKVEELMALIAALEAKVGAGETARGKLLEALLAALADSPDAAATADAWAQLAPRFDLLLQTPADVNRLQQTLLALAVKGRLVPQDPKDEPAAELLKRIRIEKARLVAEGKIKRDKPQAAIADDEQPFHPPNGWEWVRFGDIHQVAGGVTLGRKLTGKRTVSHPYLRVANVQRGALDLRQIKEVEIGEEELDRYRLRRDDLLITEGGDWDKVGRTAIWRGEIEPCLHQNHIFRARRITSDMNVEWVALFMNSAIAMAYFQASAKQTTNLASINMGELKHCAVPLPPLREQSRIVAAVASLTTLCDRLRERLAARRALSAMLASALTESALQ